MAKRRRSLTVFHIRSYIEGQKVDTFEQILRNPTEVQSFDLTAEMAFEARLFVSMSALRLPSWVAFLQEGFSDLIISEIQSTRAVLAIRIQYEDGYEIFAFTFGYGRYLLHPSSYDRNYGLRVALNVIYDQIAGEFNPNRVRSVDAKTVAANTILTRRQTDRKASFETFGIDIQRDLLRAVTGTPIKSDVWGTLISGSDSLTANPTIEFEDLGNYCNLIATTYGKDTYKESFYWIDNLKPITDPEQIMNLEKSLINTILNNSDKICLTVPEIVEWGEISTFCFSFERDNTFDDPDDGNLVDALRRTGHLDELTIENLRRTWALEGLSNESDVEYDWSLLKCLSGEIELDGKKYILSEGEFWEVSNDFIKKLDEFIEALPETVYPLPDSPGDITEGDYNVLAGQSNPNFLLMDKKVVTILGKTTPIEICDLFTDTGCFVHVKRKLSSSALSHLFAQGLNSADLFLMNPDFRTAVMNKIREQEEARVAESGDSTFRGRFSTFSVEGIAPGQYEISYAIIAKWRGRTFSGALPFFSKLTLRNHVEGLRRMGYKITVARINVAT
jgi:uncharacterized protein (TIGR04141 family)